MIATAPRPRSNAELLAQDCVILPVSEMADGDRRLEAEVYLSDGFMIRREIRRSKLPVSPLRALAKIWQPSRLKGIQVESEHGVPFLTATQAFDIWPEPRKWLAPSKTPNLAKRYVAPGWVLITCSGTVGDTIITYSAHASSIISHDLLRVEIENLELRSYVYAFLRTWFGRALMRSSHYGNIIKHLEVTHLEHIPVPVLGQLLDEVHELITEAFAAREEAYQLDMVSRKRFAAAMVNQSDTPNEEGYVVPASQLFDGQRRLEAYAHSPASQFVSEVYKQNATSIATLGEVARAFVPGRFKRIYGETGTIYLDSEPIFKINPESMKFLTIATDIEFDDYMVQRGWLLMACSGQIYGINGRAILANEKHEDKVVTQHIMRIIPNCAKIRSGYLQTVISHPKLGQPLVVSRAFGTSVPELAPHDIEQLPIPRLARQVEDEIADAAERASELRVKANEAENEAVSRLEKELERELGITPKKRLHGSLCIPDETVRD